MGCCRGAGIRSGFGSCCSGIGGNSSRIGFFLALVSAVDNAMMITGTAIEGVMIAASRAAVMGLLSDESDE